MLSKPDKIYALNIAEICVMQHKSTSVAQDDMPYLWLKIEQHWYV